MSPSTPAPRPDLAKIVAAFAEIPHCRLLGMRLEEVRRGSGIMSVAYDERLAVDATSGIMHGGVITALLDTLCGLVVMASVPEGTPLATLDLRIDYLRPAPPGEAIRASAECYRTTTSIAFVRGIAFFGPDEKPVAHCTGTFMLGGVGFSASAAGSQGTNETC
ncbi:MAG: PaaI family thioesterase [Rhodospirillales bacterium]|nr:PaaI family thioesterase [Rhodospirillales bacterium]